MKLSATWAGCIGTVLLLAIGDPAAATFLYSQPTPAAPATTVEPTDQAKVNTPVSLVPGRPEVHTSPLFPRVSASADGLPLTDAVAMILPSSFKVVFADPAFGARPVSFHGLGRPADEVLADAVSSADLAFTQAGEVITISLRGAAIPSANVEIPVVDRKGSPGSAVYDQARVDNPHKDAAPSTLATVRWTTVSHKSLRAHLDEWITQANAEGCEQIVGGCYRMKPADPDEPPEPWVVEVDDGINGDFLQALGWIKDGFWTSPRPDIEVTRNNVVILRALGASR